MTVKLRELTAVSDDDFLGGLAGLAAEGLNLLNNIHTLNNFSEDDVPAVEPWSHHRGDKELGSVGIGAGISHGEDSRAGVLQDEVLVGEFLAIDGLAPGTIVVCEVTPLKHEVRDDTVEGGVLVSEALLSSA